jgi:GxxExxY protein
MAKHSLHRLINWGHLFLRILKAGSGRRFISQNRDLGGFERLRRENEKQSPPFHINLKNVCTMAQPEYKYKEITEKIIGASMKVHSALGNGFQEVIYQRALEIEMDEMGIPFKREFEMPIFYKGREIGLRRVDFFVDEKIMVELKAIIELENVHLAQAKNYLEAYNVQVGLLINFGSISLQFKRLENSKYVSINNQNNQ